MKLIITASVFVCMTLTTAVSAHENGSIVMPLHYYSKYGIYTASLKIGKINPQVVEAIIDTGSSSLVLMADFSYCPSCKNAITKGTINPDKIKAHNLNKTVSLNYGSAKDTAIEYIAPIQFSNNDKDWLTMKLFVLKNSDQPSNILGMIHHDLHQKIVNFTPFITKLTQHFTKYSKLTFVLCGEQGNSYLQLGEINLPNSAYVSQLFTKKFYEINSAGFFSEDKKPIATPNNQYTPAIIDTGTGGYILLTKELYQPLFDYIYKHAGQSNQKLDKQFWQNNFCIKRRDVDFSSLPTIFIGFKRHSNAYKENTQYYLSFPPSAYINEAGCGHGYVRLVFLADIIPNHPTVKRNHKHRQGANVFPQMVIGTSLLNRYAITIDYKTRTLTFYNNKSLCAKQTQKSN